MLLEHLYTLTQHLKGRKVKSCGPLVLVYHLKVPFVLLNQFFFTVYVIQSCQLSSAEIELDWFIEIKRKLEVKGSIHLLFEVNSEVFGCLVWNTCVFGHFDDKCWINKHSKQRNNK